MSDWKEHKLSELGVIKTGKTPPAKCHNSFSEFKGIPFVTPKDMIGDKWVNSTERYLTQAGLDAVHGYLVDENSISVSCIGSDMGKAVLLKNKSVTNQQINTLTVSKEHNYEYVYYVLSRMQNYLKSIAGGSATPILNKTDFSNIKILLPNLDMQNKNVEYLKVLDQKIHLNQQINQTLEHIAQAIFKSWFVDFDPVHAKANTLADGQSMEQAVLSAMSCISGKTLDELHQLQSTNPKQYQQLHKIAQAFPSSFDGEVPRGWGITTIGENYNVVMGQSPKGETYNENSFGTLFYQGRAEFGWRYPKPRLYTTDPKRMAKKGDILLSVRAPVGDLNIALENCCIGRGLSALSHKNNSLSFGLYQIQNLKNEFDVFNGEGTVFGSINQKDLKAIKVLNPSLEIIKIFDEICSSNDIEIKKLSKQIISLTNLRDTLLPKLLSGEIEV